VDHRQSNWSLGNYSNDETLIAIENPTIAAIIMSVNSSYLYKNEVVVGLESLAHAQKCC